MKSEINPLEKPEKTLTKDNTKLIKFCIIAPPVLMIIAYLSGEYLLFIPAVVMAIYVYINKPKTKTEKERREDLSNKSFAVSLLVPIMVIFVICIFALIKIIPIILKSFQG
jgi:uncharacterized membrane protein YidH (DUF202 family)